MHHRERITQICESLKKIRLPNLGGKSTLPKRTDADKIINQYLGLLFPEYYSVNNNLPLLLEAFFITLNEAIKLSYNRQDIDIEHIAMEIIDGLPKAKETLIKDIIATYEGDPAATSPVEVILAYPGFYAIAVHRLAHQLYIKGVPYLPRLLTEIAHEKTGIDIHPGARIGEYFCIDHGTGIVIGETATIGDRVKIYQGVTLGAKSFELSENGNPIKGGKRHPDIGDGCIIYAGATILGGKTKIGNNCIIGGNVWLTHSVEDGKTVYYSKK